MPDDLFLCQIFTKSIKRQTHQTFSCQTFLLYGTVKYYSHKHGFITVSKGLAKIPVLWHRKHCPDEAYDTPDNLEQQWWKDVKLSLTVSPSQEVVL